METKYFAVKSISAPPAVAARGRQSRAKRTFTFVDKNGEKMVIKAYAANAANLTIHTGR